MAEPHHANHRQVAESIKELAALALAIHFVIAGVWFVVSVALGMDGVQALSVAAAAGEFILEPAYGFFGSVIGVLLGLFAVSAGGQILGSPSTIADMRRRLGWAGESLAAAALVPFTFIVVSCFSEPSTWASLLILGPQVGAIVYLALQLAGFVVWEPHLRRNLLADRIARLERARELLPLASSRPYAVVWIINSVVFAVVALVPAMAFGVAAPRLVSFAVFALLLSFVANAVGIAAMESVFTSTDRISRTMLLVSVVGSFGFTGVSALAVAPSGGWALASTAALVTVLPLASMLTRTGHAVVAEWTLRGAAARFAGRSFDKSIARNKSAFDKILPEPQTNVAPLSGRQRLRTLLDRLLPATAAAPDAPDRPLA